jgi:DNA polymerase
MNGVFKLNENTITSLNQELSDAVSRSIYSGRRLVFGEGNKRPTLILIGEAPGADEEKVGLPFVGKAGKNLNEFLSAVKLVREDIYITNTVKIRPVKLSPKSGRPVNRAPDSDEISFFKPFLMDELKILNPYVIATLGNTPLNALASLNNTKLSIGYCHGNMIKLGDFNVFPLYHPAALIYNRALKDTYREDVEKLAELIKVMP